MWIFRRIRESRRFAELEERIEKLERGHRALDMEWSDFYDKVRHALGRITKRAAIIESAQEPDGESPEASDGSLEGLSPNQKRAMQEIYLRRSRG
jgi:exonuclease VII small subunit